MRFPNEPGTVSGRREEYIYNMTDLEMEGKRDSEDTSCQAVMQRTRVRLSCRGNASAFERMSVASAAAVTAVRLRVNAEPERKHAVQAVRARRRR